MVSADGIPSRHNPNPTPTLICFIVQAPSLPTLLHDISIAFEIHD
jgi:hypothetical protein